MKKGHILLLLPESPVRHAIGLIRHSGHHGSVLF